MMDYLSQECLKFNKLILIMYQNELKPIASERWEFLFLIHCSSSMLWKMIVSNITCMKMEYIRLKHAK
ncbi:hypothetical protein LDENG_00106350 [Lucifuga dentata]|nr:hypothetical protein LDENG_00106350 [Lucifuga dentata]